MSRTTTVGEVYAQYKPASGMLSFGKGEVTEEMVAECPEHSILIPLEKFAKVTTSYVGKELTFWWMIIFENDEGMIEGALISTNNLPLAMEAYDIPWHGVSSVVRVLKEDFDKGSPFFVTI